MPPKCSHCRLGWHVMCQPVWKWGDRRLGKFFPELRNKTFKEPYQVKCECPKKHPRGRIVHPLTSDFLQWRKTRRLA